MARTLAGGEHSVMTTGTNTQCLQVLEIHDQAKRIGTMAIFADIRGLQMPRRFSGGSNTVVTTETICNDSAVIESSDR